MTVAARLQRGERSGRVARIAAAAFLGGSLLLVALPGAAFVAVGADPSPAPSAVASAAPSTEPSPAPSATPCPTPSTSPSPGLVAAASASPAPDGVAIQASPEPAASGDPCAPSTSVLDLGRDGRLTMLLLGTDYRRTLGGERIDVILVMSLDPVTKEVVAISLPRDLVYFPRARANGGTSSGLTRVNSLYEYYRRDTLEHSKIDRRAVNMFERDVEVALGVEIDYWALSRFKGFGGMIRQLGGVFVDIPEPIDDPEIGHGGAFFPKATDYKLGGLKPCTSARPCHNALVYARSRKGTVGDGYNSDFSRARRQQELVLAGARRAVSAGFSLDKLASLVGLAREKIWTDLPLSVDSALELIRLADGATMSERDTAVFGPRKWAFEDDQTPQYTFRLRLELVRAWMADRLGTATTP